MEVGLGFDDIFFPYIVHMNRDTQRSEKFGEKLRVFGDGETAGNHEAVGGLRLGETVVDKFPDPLVTVLRSGCPFAFGSVKFVDCGATTQTEAETFPLVVDARQTGPVAAGGAVAAGRPLTLDDLFAILLFDETLQRDPHRRIDPVFRQSFDQADTGTMPRIGRNQTVALLTDEALQAMGRRHRQRIAEHRLPVQQGHRLGG